jgi:tRNA pseudouridine55 synthase
VAIVDEAGRALGLGAVDDEGWLRPLRLFAWAAAQPAPEPAAAASPCP